MRSPGASHVRWKTVAKGGALAACILGVCAAGIALDAWLPLVPRDQARWITEFILRAVLVGYFGAIVVLPTVLVGASWRVLYRRRRQRTSPRAARLALASASGLAALGACELAAAAWAAWEHRMPRLPTEFAASASPGELSLVVIGGSTALGYPYDPKVSIGKVLARKIEDALPGTRVDLDMRAKLGANLEDMHKGLVTLTRRPDAILIACGHNEYLSRFATSRDAGFAEAPAGGALKWLYRASLHSPLCLRVYETVRRHRVGGPPPLVNRHQPIDPPMFTPSEHQEIVEDFRRRLESLVAYCERIGALPILMIPPANESGFEPNRSVLPGDVAPVDRERLTRNLLDARALETYHPTDATAAYRALLDSAPAFAEAHFRLARLLERAGDFAEARQHYVRARDLDGFPVRCQSELADIYRELAARRGLVLIDGPESLRPLSAHGILDDTLFHDAHHYALRTQLALAGAIFDALASRGALGLKPDATRDGPAAIDMKGWADRLGVDVTLWATVCARTGTYYMHLASARFDGSERELKQARFFEAARTLESRQHTAEALGVPGVGILPFGPSLLDWWVTPLPGRADPGKPSPGRPEGGAQASRPEPRGWSESNRTSDRPTVAR
ncbi:tetratricopeptide repeat protein [Aquisphaera insulae]|uniref:tetratricopeptide repeat protein n=1 Tax=Aquisphaera insulae TaxID=2712864 RepID=UPI0013EAD050|nr:tetratricopeptide repeat protein [Aquisphaera insulae]